MSHFQFFLPTAAQDCLLLRMAVVMWRTLCWFYALVLSVALLFTAVALFVSPLPVGIPEYLVLAALASNLLVLVIVRQRSRTRRVRFALLSVSALVVVGTLILAFALSYQPR